MIALTRLRTLEIAAPSASHRPTYISAASGLVCRSGFIYVVADDEHHLAIFRADTAAAGTLFELVPGDLPEEHKARKKAKPDFEALTFLPAFGAYPHGVLFASGSGSKPNRKRGALVALDAAGGLHGDPRIVDLSFLMTPLEAEFGKINLEGFTVAGDELCVLQRGNKGQKRNSIIRYPLAQFLDALDTARIEPLPPAGHRDYDLGAVADVPLTFTDGAALPSGELVFSAVAEDTENSFDDGPCGGAAIGLIGADGALRWLEAVDEPHKIEGLAARREGGRLTLLAVTDADNIDVPAGLFSTQLDR